MKVIIEQRADGYVAYPLGLNGLVSGQGDTSSSAVAEMNAILRVRVQEFGPEILDEASVLDAVIESDE